jgi:putative transposase
LTSLPERIQFVGWIHEAMASGARKSEACKLLGISIRTLQRWMPAGSEQISSDQRPLVSRPRPKNALSEQEQERALAVCHQPEYASLPVSQIVPKLADKGIYIASESTLNRLLKKHQQLIHRGRSKAPSYRPPATHVATAPNQLWAWDISYLPTLVKGQYYYLYLIEDLFSRSIVLADVYEAESALYAEQLVQKAVVKEKLGVQRPILHSDNGSPMRAFTLLAKLDDLGIQPSRSRPRVSDDNAFVESLFKTLKYCPEYPQRGFQTLEQARQWVHDFTYSYNHEHQHSGIRFVTPAQRHQGLDRDILEARKQVYLKAKQHHPERWTADIRDWSYLQSVTLNPLSPAQLIKLERRIS